MPLDKEFSYGESVYDKKTNPNNDRLREWPAYNKTDLKEGDRVYKLYDEGNFSAVYGTVESVENQGGKVFVRWPNGVAYQEDPLYLVKKEELPFVKSAMNKKAVKSYIDSIKRRKSFDAALDTTLEKTLSKFKPKTFEASLENALSKILTSNAFNHKEDCSCAMCEKLNSDNSEKEKESSIKKQSCGSGCSCGCGDITEEDHSESCSCPVCNEKTEKLGKKIVCTSEGCFFVREDS